MSDTMRIWDTVSKTNPANTKKVNQRGGFTSICAQSQIMEATRAFGPVGEGWGYTASVPIFHEGLVFVQVTLWHGDRENTFGPVTGGAEWKVKDRVDSDAAKKATTDALTKLLSQLGFNADVFLGLFDDSKYVEQVKREFAEPATTGPKMATITQEQITEITVYCESARIPVADLLKAAKVDRIPDIEAARFEGVKAWIERRIQKMKEAA